MKAKKRQKMCYNCEGEVDLDVIVCPFCAADLRAERPEFQKGTYNQTATVKNLNTQQSLYPPHYVPNKSVEQEDDEEPEQEAPALVNPIDEEPKSIIGPTLLMTLGSQLFLFGLLMFLFSKDGVLTFRWDARLWFVYVFTSIPLLMFGYRSISKL